MVVPHRNRSLRLEMAGQGSGDTKLRCEWHVHRLSHRESSSHGQVRGLYITVMIQFHEFRRALAPGAHRPVRSLSAQDGEDSSRPACAAGPQPSSKARLFLPVLSLSEARVPVWWNRIPVPKTDRPPFAGSQRPSHARSLHICVCENRNRSSLHTFRLLAGP